MTTDVPIVSAKPTRDPARTARPVPWHWLTLGAILLVTAFLDAWALSRNGYDNYYGAVARSGATSWKAFLYSSVDSSGFITVDKPPLTFWLESLTARVIGFGTVSLLLPQVVAAVATTAVLYRTVRLVWTETAALLSALAFALTPITVVLARENHPDMVLTLLVTLAAWGWVSAMRSGRAAPLLWSGAALGLGFLAKSWMAFVPLPAFALGYLLAAPVDLGRRLLRLAGAGAVMAAIACSWFVVVALTPAADRPYLGGTAHNTIMEFIWDYNGPGRLFSTDTMSMAQHRMLGAPPGTGRMFAADVAGQYGWLLPLAAVGLVAGLWLARRAPRTDLGRVTFAVLGGWVLLYMYVFSTDRGLWHAYYTVVMAPALAALAGAGLTVLLRNRMVYALATALIGTVLWDVALLRRTPHYFGWLALTVAVAGTIAFIVATGATAVLRTAAPDGPAARIRLASRLAAGSIAVAVAAMLAGPIAYDITTVREAGPAGLAQAGPLQQPVLPPVIWRNLPAILAKPQGLDPRMLAFLRQQRGKARWLLAVPDGPTAGSLIMATGEPVMVMNGFLDVDPALPLPRLQTMLSRGELRFVLLTPPMGESAPPATNSERDAWIQTRCAAVGNVRPGAPVMLPALFDCGRAGQL